MAKIPLILHVATTAQVLPCLAWALTRQRTRAAAALAIGAVVGGIGDIASRWMAVNFGNNHITSYIDAPVMTACFLTALREWQLTARERRAFGVGVILFLLCCVGLVAFVEDIGTFNFGISPLGSLTLLVAATWTLLRRTGALEQLPIHETDWFWAATGLAILGCATALSSPLGGFLLERGRVDLIDLAWRIRAVFVITAYLFIGWGVYRGPVVSKFSTA